jgi:hypothetical protein
MDAARMSMESLTRRPELENSQDPKRPTIPTLLEGSLRMVKRRRR